MFPKSVFFIWVRTEKFFISGIPDGTEVHKWEDVKTYFYKNMFSSPGGKCVQDHNHHHHLAQVCTGSCVPIPTNLSQMSFGRSIHLIHAEILLGEIKNVTKKSGGQVCTGSCVPTNLSRMSSFLSPPTAATNQLL